MSHHHDIDYVELPAPDLGAAQDFYAHAFGWSFTSYGPDYSGIRDATDHSAEMGGLARQGLRQPLVLLYSDDLDATLRQVEAAGGTVTTAPFDFPGGRRFHFTDPAGSELGVWTRAAAPPES